MATVGKLNIILSASTGVFTKGIDAAQKQFNAFTASLTSGKALITGALGVLGVGLSANAFKGFIEGQAEAIDQTAKFADTLGISTENLVGLQHAAELAGVSSEELSTGLARMLKNMPSGSTASDALNAIANQLDQVGNAGDKARLVVDLFGKGGVRLIPLLQQERH